MTGSRPTAVPARDAAGTTVPAPRSAPSEEQPSGGQRPRRRHDGYYWDVTSACWRRCP